MLARVAESIYWMARQVERAENVARFLEVTHVFELDQPDSSSNPWEALVRITGDNKWFKERYGAATDETLTQFLLFDRDYHSSMISALAWARQNARSVREMLSSEVYEALNDLYQYVHEASLKASESDEFLTQVRSHAITFSGVLDSTMPRDLGWHFANFGRLIERADKTSRILDVKYFQLLPQGHGVGSAVDDLQWAALLRACSGIEAYRREHQYIDIEKVVRFFLFHREFPRSVLFCVNGATESLLRIADLAGRHEPSKASAAATMLLAKLRRMDASEVVKQGMHEFVDEMQTKLNEVGAALGEDYLHVELEASA